MIERVYSKTVDFGGVLMPGILLRDLKLAIPRAERVDVADVVDEETELVTDQSAKIYFQDPDLDAAEEVSLANVIAAHPLVATKQAKFVAIDQKTQRQLIPAGFYWEGSVMSLSPNAQRTWLGMLVGKDLATYPMVVNSLDDKSTVEIGDAVEVTLFYQAAMNAVRFALDSGTTLKDQVRAAATIADVDAVVDNRPVVPHGSP